MTLAVFVLKDHLHVLCHRKAICARNLVNYFEMTDISHISRSGPDLSPLAQ